MIAIQTVKDTKKILEICKNSGVEWKPTYQVIATIEGEKVLQYAIFEYNGEEGIIHSIGGFEEDLNMLDGLCRAIMNIMEIRGVKQCSLPKKYSKLASFVGFKEEESLFTVDLTTFFKCCCHKKGE